LVGAFSGFIHENYRLFDYKLGMRNCQKFLRDYFKVFGNIHESEIPAPVWPSITKKEFEKKTKALDVRISEIVKTFADGFFSLIIKIVVRRFFKPSDFIKAELIKHQLLVK
jgi:hypothetical protein